MAAQTWRSFCRATTLTPEHGKEMEELMRNDAKPLSLLVMTVSVREYTRGKNTHISHSVRVFAFSNVQFGHFQPRLLATIGALPPSTRAPTAAASSAPVKEQATVIVNI